MKIKLADLQYVLMPAQNPNEQWADLYHSLFQFWHGIWSETFRELDGAQALFSDDFCRQDYVGAVLLNGRCVVMGFFHEIDFKTPTARHDSYFKVWNDRAIESLLKEGTRVLVGSNITVDPEFRGDLGDGFRLKTLILKMMSRTLIGTSCDVMTGTTRNDRGMDKAAYDIGASPIQSGVIHHGVPVDLMGFYRRRLAFHPAITDDHLVQTLWRNRTELAPVLSSTLLKGKRNAA